MSKPSGFVQDKVVLVTGAGGGIGRDFALALAREGARGFTTMLPSPDAAIVGKLLADRFKLPFWQVTATASDANRAVIKWCRAITGRKKILVFNHCYHGAVDDTYVTIDGGTAHADPALIGEVRDLTQFTKVVEFNDIPALEAALRAAWPWLTTEFGNPSSTHELGLRAKAALDEARASVAASLGA